MNAMGLSRRQATIEPSATGYRLIDENGSLLSEAEYGTDGSVRLLDGKCRVVNRWSKEQLQSSLSGNNPMSDEVAALKKV